MAARHELREVEHARAAEERDLLQRPLVLGVRHERLDGRLVAAADRGQFCLLRVVAHSRRGQLGGHAQVDVEIVARVRVHRRGGGREAAAQLPQQRRERRHEPRALDALEGQLGAAEDRVQDGVDAHEQRQLLLEDVVKGGRVVVIRNAIEHHEPIPRERVLLLAGQVKMGVDAVEELRRALAVPRGGRALRSACPAALALGASDVVVRDEARRLGVG